MWGVRGFWVGGSYFATFQLSFFPSYLLPFYLFYPSLSTMLLLLLLLLLLLVSGIRSLSGDVDEACGTGWLDVCGGSREVVLLCAKRHDDVCSIQRRDFFSRRIHTGLNTVRHVLFELLMDPPWQVQRQRRRQKCIY